MELSMDTMHLEDPLGLLGSEGSALTLPSALTYISMVLSAFKLQFAYI